MSSLGKYIFHPEVGRKVTGEVAEKLCPSLDTALKVKWTDFKNR